MNVTTLSQAVTTAKAQAAPQRATGCGRVYVELGLCLTVDQVMTLSLREQNKIEKQFKQKTIPSVKEAIASAGLKWFGGRVYVGYDNNTGVELGQGEAIASAFKGLGINAYMTAEPD